MIYDKLTNVLRYRGIHPNLDLALEYIHAHLADMPDHVDILGTDVYGNKFTYDTVAMDETFFEAHANFADIQIMTAGAERVDVADISVLNVDEAHPDRDFWALSGQEEVQITLAPGSFLLVLPGDAHKLKIQLGKPETVTKAVFKVRVK